MTRKRWIIAACTVTALTALLIWQRQRDDVQAACRAIGGQWDGARSLCAPIPGRPILERDGLRRS